MSETDSLAKSLWQVATASEKGRPIIIRFRVHVPIGVQTDNFPTLVKILWSYDGSVRNGLPGTEDRDRHVEFEEATRSLNENDKLGFLMLVVTGNSRKEWTHYVSNLDAWLACLSELVGSHDAYPIELGTMQDPAWTAWRDVASRGRH